MDNEFVKKYWAVVGFDYDTAQAIISAIEWSAIDKDILRRIRTKNEICTIFTDGTSLIWVKASYWVRGKKIGKMWCDKNIDKDLFECAIMPMYFGKREDINWI